jgi:prefoldin subunit 5
MSKASKKSKKSVTSRDETEALADYLARLAPFVDDGENPTATRTARRVLKHYTVGRQSFLSSLGLDSNMSFPQALNRAVNIVHKLDDDLDEARKKLEDSKARNTALVKGYKRLQENNTELKQFVQALGERLDSVQTECKSLKTGIGELDTRNRKLQAYNEGLSRRNEELEQEMRGLVKRNNELQATNHALEDAHTAL